MQIDMLEIVWRLFKVNKSKVFQLLKEIFQDFRDWTDHLTNLDAFPKELHDAMEQSQNAVLRFSAIDLFGTLGGTEEKLGKQMLLEKYRFIPKLSKIFIDQDSNDFEMKMIASRAINNFIHRNQRDFLKETELIHCLCENIDKSLKGQEKQEGIISSMTVNTDK